MSDNLLTIWIQERNDLERQLRTVEEPSIREIVETKLDRVKRKIDDLLDKPDHPPTRET